jgi:hypothetical protein
MGTTASSFKYKMLAGMKEIADCKQALLDTILVPCRCQKQLQCMVGHFSNNQMYPAADHQCQTPGTYRCQQGIRDWQGRPPMTVPFHLSLLGVNNVKNRCMNITAPMSEELPPGGGG